MKESFDVANKKDIELQADMTQLNKKRKKIKEQLEEERKKLENLEQIPEKNRKVSTRRRLVVCFIYLDVLEYWRVCDTWRKINKEKGGAGGGQN